MVVNEPHYMFWLGQKRWGEVQINVEERVLVCNGENKGKREEYKPSVSAESMSWDAFKVYNKEIHK